MPPVVHAPVVVLQQAPLVHGGGRHAVPVPSEVVPVAHAVVPVNVQAPVVVLQHA